MLIKRFGYVDPDRDRDVARGHAQGAQRVVRAPAPGKRTRTSRIYRSASASELPGSDATSALEQAAAGGGNQLPPHLREMLERALGLDLGGVRVHEDSASAEAAQAIAARAYTVGQDIYFAHGTYAPDDPEGRRLIAHEVAHAVQHGGGAAPDGELIISQPGDAAEREADRFADNFMSGGRAAPPTSSPGAIIHREADDREPAAKNRAALLRIQAKAMVALLPALRDLEPAAARSDQKTGYLVGGPRLVIAQRAAAHKGKWIDFVNGQQEALAGLPGNQVTDIISFLGAPDGAAYYDSRKFDGRFDGMIDPGSRTITLYWRVKVVAGPSARFGRAEAVGPPDEADPDRQTAQKNQQKEHEAFLRQTAAAIDKFKRELPGAIQGNWKARIKPSQPIGNIKAGDPLACSVVVTVVDSGEHKLVHVLPDVPGGRSSMGDKKGEPGILRESANAPGEPKTVPVDDGTGKMAAEPKTFRQTGSAHEFGHAIGLDHPVCPASDDRCYGRTAEEKSSQMGLGDQLTRTQRGHDDFAPFIRIAETWTKDQVKVPNTWSPG